MEMMVGLVGAILAGVISEIMVGLMAKCWLE